MNPLPNLLIVDDIKENLLFLESVIKKIKVNLIQSLSGNEALEKTSGIELALAIIDVRMPGMDGFELALNLNKKRNKEKVPVIFLTAEYFDEKYVFKGYDSGAVDYIFKPVNIQVLLSKINVFLDLFNQKQKIKNDARVLKDSTKELKKVLASLKKSEEKYRNYIDFAPNCFYTISAEHIILELNHSGELILGKERSHLIGAHIGSFVSESSQPLFNTFLQKVFTGNNKEVCEVILETESSHPKYVYIEGMVIGNRNQCLINVIDITARNIAEQAVVISEEKYRTMLNSSPDGIVLIDMKGIITEVSDIGIQLFGAETSGDLVGKNVRQFIAPGEKKNIREILKKTLNEGLVQNYELLIKKKNKDLVAGEISVTLIQRQDSTPVSFMIIVRDITQRKKAETKQIHADRMANLGEMASGIAHEINQPLNIISMVMDKILFESAKTKSVDIQFLKIKSDKIFENITRIKNIIDHIRAFSRSHDDYVLTAFDINSSIENAASMVIEQFKHLGIDLDLQLGNQIPQIIGNTYKFEQVIINLLVNAKDAVIEKKSKKPEYTEMIIGIRSYHENQFVVVEISDNGFGISDNDINNIMLPFFTTKDEGQGTGLGLSICYQIIKEMNGTIDIKSKCFIGTKIKIVLDIQKNK